MAELKEKIKKLITKAKESGDGDLLELAIELLDEISVPEPATATTSAVSEANLNFDRTKLPSKFSEFSMNKTSNTEQSTVTPPGRVNKFVDDGSEHKDLINKTPEITITERSRPKFALISQFCSKCNKEFEINPAFKRDFFVCDRCLRK